eukprot:GILK01006423.1.p1 GENE.GILK01006423.1~~GILK01006423.1.p1  ORF type:complete len:688 (+),score=164.79 GILK01006423.1:104-2167(+)
MPPKKQSSLGRAIIKDKRKKNTGHKNATHPDLFVADIDDDAKKTAKLRSVIDQNDLDAFLSEAVMADKDFTAARQNVMVLDADTMKPIDATEDSDAEDVEEITPVRIPRRPSWDESTTPEMLDRQEKDSFLAWRREVATKEESWKTLSITPFEKNIEVWRQLWRVIERSDVVVQIVDGRNPLFYRCPDLEDYVHEVDSNKKNVLVINKADYLTRQIRQEWAEYFKSQGINHIFFSAILEQKRIEEESEQLLHNDSEEEEDHESDHESDHSESNDESAAKAETQTKPESIDADVNQLSLEPETTMDDPIHVHNREELLQRFLMAYYDSKVAVNGPIDKKVTIGMVGYPNVGKSSIINVLAQEKKVGVAAQPGKTKHFQTLHIDENIVLCDCPGLVFPSFIATRADMVLCGVLPIDQIREVRGPAALLASRIPREVLNSTYGFTLPRPKREEDPNRYATAEEVMQTWARTRGYMTGRGTPDESRAARYLFKDYVAGKILYCHLPPESQLAGGSKGVCVTEGVAFFQQGLKSRDLIESEEWQKKDKAQMKRQAAANAGESVPEDGRSSQGESALVDDIDMEEVKEFKQELAYPKDEGRKQKASHKAKIEQKNLRKKANFLYNDEQGFAGQSWVGVHTAGRKGHAAFTRVQHPYENASLSNKTKDSDKRKVVFASDTKHQQQHQQQQQCWA